MLIEICSYIIIGCFSGIISGLLGAGGGIIIVPTMYFLYKFLNPNVVNPMHIAITTSLAAISITTLFTTYLYQKRQGVFFSIFKHLNIPLIIGSVFGVFISFKFPKNILVIIFSVIAFLYGTYFLFSKKLYKRRKKPKKLMVFISGLIIGTLATLLGVGGGLIALPFFIMALSVPNYYLVGTASLATFITSIIGTICYIVAGSKSGNSIYSLGIDPLAFMIISIVSLFFVSLGIKLEEKINIHALKIVFSLILIITSVFMFYNKVF